MSEALLFAIVSGSSAIIGGVVVGVISIWNTKIAADREDRRRRLDIERENAEDRINKLYQPLLKILTPPPPYDEFYIDTETQKWAIEKIEKNEMCASPDLLNAFWALRHVYYEKRGNINRDFEWEFYELVSEEHARLKAIIGYGRILKKKSIIRKIIEKIKSYIKEKRREFRLKRHVKRVKKRRSKTKVNNSE